MKNIIYIFIILLQFCKINTKLRIGAKNKHIPIFSIIFDGYSGSFSHIK